MHFGFALELSDIDLWNTDLLDTHLNLLSPDKYTDIPSKYFVCLHNIFKTSSKHVFTTSSRHVLKTSSRRLQRNNPLSSKTSSRRLCKISCRRLQDVFKTNKCLLGSYIFQYIFCCPSKLLFIIYNFPSKAAFYITYFVHLWYFLWCIFCPVLRLYNMETSFHFTTISKMTFSKIVLWSIALLVLVYSITCFKVQSSGKHTKIITWTYKW